MCEDSLWIPVTGHEISWDFDVFARDMPFDDVRFAQVSLYWSWDLPSFGLRSQEICPYHSLCVHKVSCDFDELSQDAEFTYVRFPPLSHYWPWDLPSLDGDHTRLGCVQPKFGFLHVSLPLGITARARNLMKYGWVLPIFGRRICEIGPWISGPACQISWDFNEFSQVLEFDYRIFVLLSHYWSRSPKIWTEIMQDLPLHFRGYVRELTRLDAICGDLEFEGKKPALGFPN